MPEIIKFYNTLSRSIEALEPRQPGVVGLYACGPTVYAQGHIGNFRTFLFQDVLRRVLQTAGYKVIHARNLTDVDDKTINRANQEGKSLAEVTEHWTKIFQADCARFNLLPPQIEPKATEHIDEQIAMIAMLIEKGHAYRSDDGSVYFRVSSFDNYGKLSRVKERELKTQSENSAGKPIDNDEYERDSVADFALWKSRKPADGDVFWESPWGQGRPGWHIECSAMSMKYLARNLDIHSGGIDLTFPHHENEIAQSECSCGHDFFKYWIHGAHLMVDGAKMSKSLGNMYNLDDIEAKGFAPVVLRYALTSGHYRQTANFTLDTLHAADSALQRLRKHSDALLAKHGQTRAALLKEIAKNKHAAAPWGAFEAAWNHLANDLNVPAALGVIFTGIKSADDSIEASVAFHKLIYALGYDLDQVALAKSSEPAPAEIQALAQQRWDAKQSKDWAAADTLRQQIETAGWKVLDRKDGFDLEKL